MSLLPRAEPCSPTFGRLRRGPQYLPGGSTPRNPHVSGLRSAGGWGGRAVSRGFRVLWLRSASGRGGRTAPPDLHIPRNPIPWDLRISRDLQVSRGPRISRDAPYLPPDLRIAWDLRLSRGLHIPRSPYLSPGLRISGDRHGSRLRSVAGWGRNGDGGEAFGGFWAPAGWSGGIGSRNLCKRCAAAVYCGLGRAPRCSWGIGGPRIAWNVPMGRLPRGSTGWELTR